MTRVAPTTLDVSRSIARLDEHASIGKNDTIKIDGIDWTRKELIENVSGNIAFTTSRGGVNTLKITRGEVKVILASHGASQFTIHQFANDIARAMRADFANHSW